MMEGFGPPCVPSSGTAPVLPGTHSIAATAALLLLLQTPDAAEDAVGVQAAADY